MDEAIYFTFVASLLLAVMTIPFYLTSRAVLTIIDRYVLKNSARGRRPIVLLSFVFSVFCNIAFIAVYDHRLLGLGPLFLVALPNTVYAAIDGMLCLVVKKA